MAPSPTWVGWGTMSSPVPLATRTDKIATLSSDQLAGIQETASSLASYNLAAPRSPADLALHRALLGATRDDAADGLLDFVISLEALLLPGSFSGEISYRFRLHGAVYLAGGEYERQKLWDELHHLYDVRSRLVHGGKYPDLSEVQSAAEKARSLASIGLLKAILQGFPSAETLKTLTLGDG